LVEFLLVERAGTSTFFLLLIIALVDVLVGFTVSVRTSQRQVEIQAEGRPDSRLAPAVLVRGATCPCGTRRGRPV
jgi:hypothetical protein